MDIQVEKIEIKPKPESYWRQHWWQVWKPKKPDWSQWKFEEYQEVQSWADPDVEEILKRKIMKNINASRND